ncbi:MAG: hypothetical protein PF495_16930, partial [Spirochaetales bacterium]|nr:hypothetical protein [Spirochaetales bacterium]
MIGDIFGFLVTHRIHILIFFVGYVLGCLTIIINYYSHNRDRGVENQNLRVQKQNLQYQNQNLRVQKQNLQDQNQNLRVKDKQIKDARKTRPPEHPNPKDPHNTKPKMNGPSNSNNLKEKGVPGAPCGFQDEDHLELFIVDSFESELVENYNQAVLADNVGAFRVKYGAQLKRVGPEEKQTEKVTLAERNDGEFYAISDKESG